MDNIKKTLLLVDDEPNILKALERTLSEEHYTILTAGSGQKALELLEIHPIQVILTDQRMPNMTGSELLIKVRASYPNTVRMILSAYTDFDVVKDAINEGSIYKFINKPWENDELTKCVREAFNLYAQEQNKEKQLNKLMYQDNLTGLNNRFRFISELSSAMAKSKDHNKIALVLIHIDNFSNINNSLGRQAGDKALQLVAEHLRNEIKKIDNLCCLGGDSFAFLIENPPSDLTLFVDNVLNECKAPFTVFGTELYLTFSVGISIYPDHSTSVEELMKFASLSQQRSKESGGNNIQIFNSKIDVVDQQINLIANLYKALEKKQFEVYYQPIAKASNRQIVGAEALIRWHHPERGLLAPAAFLDLCEQTGLIVPIGHWVLRSACQQLKEWKEMGYDRLSIAVNISARQFYNEGLYESIVDVINTTRIAPANLKLELTESLLMKNIDKNVTLLESLNRIGVQLSLDDFGTGYSSFNYLKLFSFKYLKIDQSFIQDITTKKEHIAIVAAIISLGKSLNLTIIAEGVETEEQFELLKSLQCDLIQGYLFSKPIPAKEFTKLLKLGKLVYADINK